MKMPSKRNKPISETQLVSLADITFLIIFFFMLTSSFMRDKGQIPLPQVPKIGETKSLNAVSLDGQGRIFFNGDPVDTKEVLEGKIRDALAGKTAPADLEIRFKCDRGLSFKDYKGVLEAISNAGGVIAIMHDIKTTAPPPSNG